MGFRANLLGLAFIALLCLGVSNVHCRSAFYNTTSSRLPGKLNVHIISHTHNDPGWLNTYAQYHRTHILDGHVIGGVEAILDSTVSQLLDNPDRTFVYADLAFFVKWWQELHTDTQAIVHKLVQQGRFEFTNGGIVQHDEATSHYSGMIDQMTLGMRFLQQEFNMTPKIAWQLDGFGHSNTEAFLKSLGGFEALFFGRSDEADLEQRKMQHGLELIWRGSQHYGTETDMFVSQYPTGNYGPPSKDWWFERRDDYGKSLADWLGDDPEGQLFNMHEIVDAFVAKAQEWQSYVQGEDVLFMMGGDFSHSDARMWYNNVDKIIHYVNKDGRVNAFYSTPSRYVQAKRSTPGINYALKTDDFFPYSAKASGSDYWTGFYTSRPALKSQIRRGWALLQAARQVEVLSELQPSSRMLATSKALKYTGYMAKSETAQFGNQISPDHDLAPLEFALSVSLHHDGITGTQKLHVTRDYEHWIHVATTKAAPKFLQGLQHMLYPHAGINTLAPPNNNKQGHTSAATGKMPVGGLFRRLQQADSPSAASNDSIPDLHMCLSMHLRVCASSVSLSDTTGFLLVVYNPLSWQYKWGVRVPVSTGRYSVTGPDGADVPSQIMPLTPITERVWRHYGIDKALRHKPSAELSVTVSAPPLGHAVYKVTRLPDTLQFGSLHSKAPAISEVMPVKGVVKVSNGLLELTVTPMGISTVAFGDRVVQFSSSLIAYQGTGESFPGSGAYVFQANGWPAVPYPAVSIVKGAIVQEVRQEYTLGVLVTRLWAGSSHLEVEWTVGPPPAELDWEVFVRYSTDIQSAGVWYTDANGREYQQRKRQYRPSFVLDARSKFLPGNIYPITTGCYLKDNTTALHIAVDRAQGAVSLRDGQLDINLHRGSAGDDEKGMQEPLIDNNIVTGTHIISFELPDASGSRSAGEMHRAHRHHEQILNDPLQLAFSNISAVPYQPTSTGLVSADALPANVHLLTVKWLSCDTVLVRFSHMFQAGEHPALSQPATIDLFNVMKLKVVRVQEAMLFGERAVNESDAQRPVYAIMANITKWDPPLVTEPAGYSHITHRTIGSIANGTTITLNPMQIRTFYFSVTRTQSSCTDSPNFAHNSAAHQQSTATASVAATSTSPSRSFGATAQGSSWLHEVETEFVKAQQATMAWEAAAADLIARESESFLHRVAYIGHSSSKASVSHNALLVLLAVPFCVAVCVASMLLSQTKQVRLKAGDGKKRPLLYSN